MPQITAPTNRAEAAMEATSSLQSEATPLSKRMTGHTQLTLVMCHIGQKWKKHRLPLAPIVQVINGSIAPRDLLITQTCVARSLAATSPNHR